MRHIRAKKQKKKRRRQDDPSQVRKNGRRGGQETDGSVLSLTRWGGGGGRGMGDSLSARVDWSLIHGLEPMISPKAYSVHYLLK